jgi:hypothetical protein
MLFGELVWTNDPPEQFLAFLGVPPNHYWFEREAQDVFSALGMQIIMQETASSQAWNDYETAVSEGRLAFAKALGPEGDAIRQRAEGWSAAYAQWGKYCLGFMATLARKSSV